LSNAPQRSDGDPPIIPVNRLRRETAGMSTRVKALLAILLGLALVASGVLHFMDPGYFEPLVPEQLGSAAAWVFVSGVAEIAVGLGLVLDRGHRRRAGTALAVLLVVLYVGNLNMWLNDITIGETNLSTTGHVIRALVQVLLIAAALWIGGRLPKQGRPAEL
jgi:uncharacterized membrane protein